MSFISLLHDTEHVHHQKNKLTNNVLEPIQNKTTWTKEQQDFLQSSHPKTVLTALAGSGKTSLLLEYARLNRHQKWNFIVFNTSIAHHTQKIAPPNMSIKTVHQMAFSHFGRDLHHKLQENFQNNQIQHHIHAYNKLIQPHYVKLVKKSLENYLYSQESFLDKRHIDKKFLNLIEEKFQEKIDEKTLMDDLLNLWEKCLSPSSDFVITHDVYLKRFSMVHHAWPGKYWMLDEGQDWSDAFLASWRQNTEYSIRAGDPFQKIYDWNNQHTLPWVVPGEQEFWLTHSFRTNQGLEDYVNQELRALSSSKKWSSALNQKCDISNINETVEHIQNFQPDVILASRWNVLQDMYNQLIQAKIPCCLINENQHDFCVKQGIQLRTIHTSKGLDFNRVWIADNFLSKDEAKNMKHKLLYVALTRTKKAIRIPLNIKININEENQIQDI